MSVRSLPATPAGRLQPRAGGERAGDRYGDDPAWRWATLAPSLAIMLALSVLPLLNLFWLSFNNVTWSGGVATWTPVGLTHYKAVFSDALFRAGVWNTTVFALGAVTGQMILGFVMALYCSRIQRGRVLYRALFILPILIPGIVVGAIWKLMLNYDFGLANQALGLVGIEPVDWLGANETALLSVILVDIWHWTPFCFLLFLAGLESMPRDVYEAAHMDGASGWQELLHVTLPMMLPTIMVTFAFRIVLAFKVFDEVYLLTGGGPGTATEVVSFTLYQRFFTEDRVGYGAAMSIIVIFLVSVLLVLALSARRRSETGP
ncbi:sugar ABC transporter permease [Alsobacter sp. SYSU M60028]|uniref:Sugar ABC transporter permease n=1 Tax=Alsobacter ponti TaxID=2962936 RepID=A0ABT1LLI9_9HYPH|nr:sugar ABC transporter permease [Alsobacter ponti]MCP8941103.1 sugar ABC transporter permease [Alsobacter ponti]